MPKYYNGKYPHHIESVWQVPERINPKRPWVFRTNCGAMYTFRLSMSALHSASILCGRHMDTIEDKTFLENSERLVPGPKCKKYL